VSVFGVEVMPFFGCMRSTICAQFWGLRGGSITLMALSQFVSRCQSCNSAPEQILSESGGLIIN
jgi:hypothetical protein